MVSIQLHRNPFVEGHWPTSRDLPAVKKLLADPKVQERLKKLKAGWTEELHRREAALKMANAGKSETYRELKGPYPTPPSTVASSRNTSGSSTKSVDLSKLPTGGPITGTVAEECCVGDKCPSSNINLPFSFVHCNKCSKPGDDVSHTLANPDYASDNPYLTERKFQQVNLWAALTLHFSLHHLLIWCQC